MTHPASAPARILATVVVGPSARAREQAIARHLSQNKDKVAVILEGLPDGSPILQPSSQQLIERIAPGCLCCTGNLVLRVTLNRLLRQHPTRLFIGLARSEHLGQLRSWLGSAPYDQLLELGPDLYS